MEGKYNALVNLNGHARQCLRHWKKDKSLTEIQNVYLGP